MSHNALGVDLGGTNLRCAAISDQGEIHGEFEQLTRAERGPDAVIEDIASIVERTAAAANLPPDVGVGVASPGPLNPRTGVVHFAPNLHGWRDIPLRDQLQARLRRRVLVGNDANAAAVGELMFGAGRGRKHLIYVGLGTGVGGGVISDGRLVDGVAGMGAELGHVSVNFDGPRCTCGSSGCIEAYCSGWAFEEAVALLVRSGRADAILAAAGTAPVSPRAIAAAAEGGDQYAKALLDRAGTALGVGLANFVNIFNPEIICLGGGLAGLGESLLGPARQALFAWSMPMMRERVTLASSELGARTGIYGAAALVFHDSGRFAGIS